MYRRCTAQHRLPIRERDSNWPAHHFKLKWIVRSCSTRFTIQHGHPHLCTSSSDWRPANTSVATWIGNWNFLWSMPQQPQPPLVRKPLSRPCPRPRPAPCFHGHGRRPLQIQTHQGGTGGGGDTAILERNRRRRRRRRRRRPRPRPPRPRPRDRR